MERKFLVVLLVVAMFFVSGPQALLPAQPTLFVDSDGDGFDDSVDPCPDSEGTWLTTVIDSADGSGNGGLSIALDSNDNPRIAYHQSEQNSLRHANYSDGQWSLSTIAIGTDVGIGVDIEINQNDSSVFAYTLGYDIKLYNEETGLHPKSVKGYSSVYGAIELEIDTQDRAFATYHSNNVIDPSISTAGQYFISFDTTGDDGLLQATNKGYHSLETLPSGELVVILNGLLYTDLMNEYSGQVSGQDTGDGRFYPSISSRSDGSLGYVSVKGPNGGIVEYRTIIDGVVESVETVEAYTGDAVRERTEMTFDSEDQPHVVYSRLSQLGFTYAQKENGVWNLSTIDSESGTIRNPVIDIDSNNQPHIAYHRDDSGALVYTTKSMTDSDGDGCLDHEDAFPDDAFEQFDSDGDGVGDNEESTGRVFSINPVNGTSAGGTEVTLTGVGFDSLNPAPSYVETIPMLGYWKMDGEDSDNQIEDFSGNNWDAIPEGQPSFDEPGVNNDSIGFDGTDDYLWIPGADFSGLSQMSVSAWINPTDLGNSETNRMIMTHNDAWYIYLQYTSSGTILTWSINGISNIDSTTTFTEDTWYHVAAAWDGNYACVYVNAVAEGCRAYPDVTSSMPSRTTYPNIGAQGSSGAENKFHGFIDDVRLYDSYLTASDIESLYESGGGILPLEQYGHWKFEEDSGPYLDSSGNGNNGDCGPPTTCPQKTSGVNGSAALFDGVDDWIEFADSDFSAMNDITVNAWIKWYGPTGGGGNDMIIGHDHVWYLFTQSGDSKLRWEVATLGTVISTMTIDTEWHHIVGTWNSSSDEMCLYIDGQQDVCITSANNDMSSSPNTNPSIGAQTQTSGGANNFFNGKIDDARIFDRALSANEIADLHSFSFGVENNSETNGTGPLQARFSTSDWNETVNLTYVDNNTLTLTTPSGPEGETVNLTLIGADGQELLLPDAYTFDSTAIDSDGDGFLDSIDDCPSTSGNSTADRTGCIDSDGDGYSDADDGWNTTQGADPFPFEKTQWSDWDGDGYGDNFGNLSWELTRSVAWPGIYREGAFEQDGCPTASGNSTGEGILGCPDSDGDSHADYRDYFPVDVSQWSDQDGDGYGDNSSVNATTPDACADEWGNSTFDRYGCLDSDGDGMSDDIDDFPFDAERTSDVDQDGLDDLFDDNCPNTNNPLQEDHDGDGMGDACDTDEDNDGVHDGIDNCIQGMTGWTSETLLDYDGDGCLDGSEDSDDDGDGVDDGMDGCPKGDFGWTSSSETDHDSDGCNDESEDLDDDDDGKDDSRDDCPRGANDWESTTMTDRDADGCRDSDEDDDDDGDGVNDDVDLCPLGLTQWISDEVTDANNDGCKDGAESPETEEKIGTFMQRLSGGDLDAIGIMLAIILPVVGISLSIMLRKRKTAMVQTIGRMIELSQLEAELDEIKENLMDLVTKDSIGQVQYDVLKAKLEDRRSTLHSMAFTAQTDVMAATTQISVPSPTQNGYVVQDGYEWLDHGGRKWYRTPDSGGQWAEWQQ